MPDREKVIEHFADCVKIAACQANQTWVFVRTDILRDGLAMLKAQEPRYPVCERCGKQIDHINTSVFQYDGTDSEYQMPLTFDEKSGCVVFETTQNWTSYELTDEERKEGIRCPHCGEYPFDSSVEIEFHEPVEVLMWTSKRTDDIQREYEAAIEMQQYCERYEPTYNQEDGGL